MRKAICAVIVFAFIFALAAPVFADIVKIKDGVVKVVKSPLIILDHTKTEMEDHDVKPFGFTKGLVESPFYMLKDIGGGLIDIVTFPID